MWKPIENTMHENSNDMKTPQTTILKKDRLNY